jgi:hypothetical protein
MCGGVSCVYKPLSSNSEKCPFYDFNVEKCLICEYKFNHC